MSGGMRKSRREQLEQAIARGWSTTRIMRELAATYDEVQIARGGMVTAHATKTKELPRKKTVVASKKSANRVHITLDSDAPIPEVRDNIPYETREISDGREAMIEAARRESARIYGELWQPSTQVEKPVESGTVADLAAARRRKGVA